MCDSTDQRLSRSFYHTSEHKCSKIWSNYELSLLTLPMKDLLLSTFLPVISLIIDLTNPKMLDYIMLNLVTDFLWSKRTASAITCFIFPIVIISYDSRLHL